jgi:hypothetical protein
MMRVRTHHKYRNMLHAEFLADGSLFVVERPWSSIAKKFAAPLYRPTFGS